MAAKKKRKKKQTTSRSDSSKYRRLALTRATEKLLGHKVIDIEYPGGRNRESYRMLLEGHDSVIATRRNSIERARVEISTLSALTRQNAPAPKLLASNHSHILIQEEIRGTRLSKLIQHADEEQCQSHLRNALESLACIQSAATAEDLESKVDTLGDEESWILGLIKRPGVIGRYLDVKAPKLDRSSLVRKLAVVEPSFVKWDSRPGNALVEDTGRVVWFDWEHAGKRNRLDDMAWVLGDEFVPDMPAMESELIEQFVPVFAGPMTTVEAREYLMAYGSFHLVVRLGLILKHMDGKWWDLDYCIDGDKVGVTLMCAQRLCRRGARWSANCDLTSSLSTWFNAVEKRLETL